MLERIVIDHFKSFKERTEISFVKTNYNILPGNVAENGILKGTLFVGPNASGKSNIICAIKFLLDSLFANTNINSEIYPCLFSEKKYFSIDYYFYINQEHISYHIDVDPIKPFITETLLVSDELLFERIGQSARTFQSGETDAVYDESYIDKETLFLRTLYFNTKFAANKTLRLWMEYLASSVYLNAHERRTVCYGKNVQELIPIRYLQNNGDKRINEFFEKYNFDQEIEYAHEVSSNTITLKVGSGDEEKDIFFKRKGLGTPIPFNQESLGNQNLIFVLPSFFKVLEQGGLLLIDEFSSGFHNDLEELLVKYFMEKSNNSQLIFVSHSTNLLSNSLLRPDQEYAVEFNGANGSTVKRFSSEQPRMAQNVEKMYLSGVFGGLPNYGG